MNRKIFFYKALYIILIFLTLTAVFLMTGCRGIQGSGADKNDGMKEAGLTLDHGQLSTWQTPDSVLNGEGGKTTPVPEGWPMTETFSSVGDITYHPDIDLDNNFSNLSVCEGDKMFYICGGNAVMVYNRETGVQSVLCNRANCQHNDFSCAAYAPRATVIQYYDGAIYTVYTEMKDNVDYCNLYRIAVDGGGKEKVQTLAEVHLEKEFDDGGYEGYYFFIHRGYVYYWYKIGETGTEYDRYVNGNNCIWRIPLGKEQGRECVLPLEISNLYSIRPKAFGDDIYLVHYVEETSYLRELLRINTEKKVIEKVPLKNTVNTFYVDSERIYYSTLFDGGVLNAYNFDTGEDEILFTFPEEDGYEFLALLTDGKYWYVRMKKEEENGEQFCFYVYDWDYQLAAKILENDNSLSGVYLGRNCYYGMKEIRVVGGIVDKSHFGDGIELTFGTP